MPDYLAEAEASMINEADRQKRRQLIDLAGVQAWLRPYVSGTFVEGVAELTPSQIAVLQSAGGAIASLTIQDLKNLWYEYHETTKETQLDKDLAQEAWFKGKDYVTTPQGDVVTHRHTNPGTSAAGISNEMMYLGLAGIALFIFIS